MIPLSSVRVGVEKPGFFDDLGGNAKISSRNPVSGKIAFGGQTPWDIFSIYSGVKDLIGSHLHGIPGI